MWEVFFVPHTDDESIGMGGAIARARAAQREVLVVLVTDNRPSDRGSRLFAACPDVVAARRDEWRRAMRSLDVTRTEEWDINEAEMSVTPFESQAEIERRMREIHKELNAVHYHSVWGIHDTNINTGYGHLAHGLCANALIRIAMARLDISATLYGVYVYSHAVFDRRAPRIRTLTEDEFAAKRRALDCYKAGPGSIGYGYRSVPELIDNASLDPREFEWEIARGEPRR